MNITKDKVVAFHYRMYEGDTELESSTDQSRMLYLHGHEGILPALEKALEGKSAGDSIDVTLDPDQAYGRRREIPHQRIPVKHLMPKRKPAIGDIFQVNTEDGPRQVVIKKVGKFNVDVDTNHPLAGKTLRFEIDVSEVRDATDEELAHGHAHGTGGHHH